jgi:hypothetical protein
LFEYPELVPFVLEHFEHPRDLAVLAKVCSSWYKIVRKRLYRNIWVRPCKSPLTRATPVFRNGAFVGELIGLGEDGCRGKLMMLMDTLDGNEELCGLVHKLGQSDVSARWRKLTLVDVRFFPLAAQGGERLDLDDQVRKAIGQMANLESLVWTVGLFLVSLSSDESTRLIR